MQSIVNLKNKIKGIPEPTPEDNAVFGKVCILLEVNSSKRVNGIKLNERKIDGWQGLEDVKV